MQCVQMIGKLTIIVFTYDDAVSKEGQKFKHSVKIMKYSKTKYFTIDNFNRIIRLFVLTTSNNSNYLHLI